MFNKITDYFKLKKQDKEDFAKFLCQIAEEILVAEREFSALFSDKNEYVDVRKANDWKNKFSKTHDNASSFLDGGMIEKKKLPRKYEPVFKRIVALYSAVDNKIKEHNKALLSPEKENAVRCFSKVCPDCTPTENQLSAILSRDKRLLISGAPSTGKTSALISKYKYLTEKGEKVLLLNALKQEEFVETALNLLKHNQDIKYSPLSDKQLKEMIISFFNDKLSDASYRGRLIDYYFNFHTQGKTLSDFETREMYENYIKLCPPVTLKGELVKNYEELSIANFLFSIGIDYDYQVPFVTDVTLKGSRMCYRPSFTLTKYQVCINLFFNEENIEEIREIHKEAEIPLIECFAEEKSIGNMLPKLQKVLSAYDIQFNIKNDNEILDAIQKIDETFFSILAESVLHNLKAILATGQSESAILTSSRSKSKTTSPLYKRRERLISLTLPFFNYYNSKIKYDNFSILCLAANKLSTLDVCFDYSHIFVDNAENLNASSALFLRALAEKTNCKIVFAGCDWVSSVCLNGTDSTYFRDFGRFFPGNDEITCDKVFNVPTEIYSTMTKFALNNSGNYDYKPYYNKKIPGTIEKHTQPLSELLATEPNNNNTLVVCRYDFEIEEVKKITNVKCVTAFEATGKYDTVIWYNSKYSNFGFPDEKICLNNISNLILNRPDSDILVGERNLLCRAMACATNRFIVLCDNFDVSNHIKELFD